MVIKEDVTMTEFTIHVALTDAQMKKLTEIKSLRDAYRKARNFAPVREGKYTLQSLLDTAIICSMDSVLDEQIAFYKEEPEQESETVSNAEEASVPASAVADAREEEPETLISVRDASGVVRMVTLDEMEDMREAAQGIYAGEPPEPQDEPDEPDADGEEEEPETVSNAEETSDDGERKFYILDWYDGLLDVADTYAEALERFNMAVERFGVSPESLEIVTSEERKKRKSQSYEEYARRTKKKEDALKKPSPLIKDNSDGYFYYLEHGHWPPDDEVLAGADVPCTGDYGLSDCLVVTQSTLDFVDAFFT